MGNDQSRAVGLGEAQFLLGLTPGAILRLVETGELGMDRAPYGLRFEFDELERVARRLREPRRNFGVQIDH